jgi:hypothetical protein
MSPARPRPASARHPELGDPRARQADQHGRRLRQLAYGFNYYGTVGCNRDEQVVLHKVEDRRSTGWNAR